MIAQHKYIQMDVGALKPFKNNARKHSKKQIKQIAKSIEQFGFYQSCVD